MGLGLIRARVAPGRVGRLGRVHLAFGCVDGAGGVAALAHPSWIDGGWVHGLMVSAVAVVAGPF